MRRGSQTTVRGPIEWFTGDVYITPIISKPNSPSRVTCAIVTFEPGARTAWHTHPLGQILIVLEGRGLVQKWGGPVEEIGQGDVVLIQPGEKHWHGATPSSSMTHVAIQEEVDGRTAEWMERVEG